MNFKIDKKVFKKINPGRSKPGFSLGHLVLLKHPKARCSSGSCYGNRYYYVALAKKLYLN